MKRLKFLIGLEIIKTTQLFSALTIPISDCLTFTSPFMENNYNGNGRPTKVKPVFIFMRNFTAVNRMQIDQPKLYRNDRKDE